MAVFSRISVEESWDKAASSPSIPSKGRLHQGWPRHLLHTPGQQELQVEEMPREFLQFPSLETFQSHLGAFLCHLLLLTLGRGGWTRWCPEAPSNPNNSVVL